MSDYKTPASFRWKNQYSFAYKMELIESIENGILSQNQATKQYRVHQKTIARWLDKYGNFEKRLKEMGDKSSRQEIAELHAKFRVSEDENEVYKAIMGILEEEYGEVMLKKYLLESLIKTLP